MPELQNPKHQEIPKFASKCQKSYEVKDESAVNHEIATLLLNLASKTQNIPSAEKQESVSNMESEAMDLSTYAKAKGVTNSVKASSMSPSFQASFMPSTINPYSLISPNLAITGINNPTVAAGLSSSYLLQNLLLGQMQQLTTPQHPQAKAQGTSASQKNTQNMKPSESQNNNNPSSKNEQSLSLSNLGQSTIPLLSGQIVAQLNHLLFSVHGITDKSLEMNVQGQLAAIYTRLQEIVAMITLSQKKESMNNTVPPSENQQSKTELQKAAKSGTSKAEKVENKMAKHFENYQKALSDSKTEDKVFASFPTNDNVVNLLRNQTPISSESLKAGIPSNKSQEEPQSPDSQEYYEDRSSSPDSRRRFSRDSLPDSPPEKRSRLTLESNSNSAVSCSSSPQSTSRSKSSGKGGKGIRNRVFCGDCPGCLKNDDCGQCRYCRDKTKFGGQNRLRQKCLHRRCQMDTHRRSNGNSASHQQPQPTQSDSISTNPQIYSGVDLARFATQQQSAISDAVGGGDVALPAEHSIFSSLLGNVSPITTDVKQLTQPNNEKDTERYDKEDSKEKDSVEQQQSRSNKWKAKHEAMLKLASGPTLLNGNANSHKKEMIKSEAKHGRQQIFENSNLVITVNETKENNENMAVNTQTQMNDERSQVPKLSIAPCSITKIEKGQNKLKYIERNHKTKGIETKKETGRLTTRSMKTVLAV